MTTQLSININKVALIRNARSGNNPDLLKYAQQCIQHGAHGITIHPRPDQRHIRADDAHTLKQHLEVELNIEGNPFESELPSNRPDVSDYPSFLTLIERNQPAQCTLVPDTRQQLTSDHGFDLRKDGERLAPLIQSFKNQGIRVSLFMAPDTEQITLAKDVGADRVELYTGPYAHNFDCEVHDKALFTQYRDAGEYALSIGLGLNAGHDLNLNNLAFFKQLLPDLHEVSIGHALTVDALNYGLKDTIERYLSCLQ
ncbi:MAG: pyridoxine 5'-phosphate synthase [Pseudomonadota bacterium]